MAKNPRREQHIVVFPPEGQCDVYQYRIYLAKTTRIRWEYLYRGNQKLNNWDRLQEGETIILVGEEKLRGYRAP